MSNIFVTIKCGDTCDKYCTSDIASAVKRLYKGLIIRSAVYVSNNDGVVRRYNIWSLDYTPQELFYHVYELISYEHDKDLDVCVLIDNSMR